MADRLKSPLYVLSIAQRVYFHWREALVFVSFSLVEIQASSLDLTVLKDEFQVLMTCLQIRPRLDINQYNLPPLLSRVTVGAMGKTEDQRQQTWPRRPP